MPDRVTRGCGALFAGARRAAGFRVVVARLVLFAGDTRFRPFCPRRVGVLVGIWRGIYTTRRTVPRKSATERAQRRADRASESARVGGSVTSRPASVP